MKTYLGRKMYSKVISFFKTLKILYSISKAKQRTPYRIEELDIKNDKVIIQCRGINAVIKIDIIEAISDNAIIDGLPSIHACWLGYNYAKSPQSTMGVNKVSIPLRGNNSDRFKIISFLPNSSEITYCDKRSNQVYKEKVIMMLKNEFLISNIHPSQACYIGLQAGYEVASCGSQILSEKKNHKPSLYVIK